MGATAIAAGLLAFPALSSAQYVTPTDPPKITPTVISTTSPSAVLGRRQERRGGLPVTGTDVVAIAGIGAGAVAMGTLARRRSRRRPSA